MKKKIILPVILLSIALTACGKNEVQDNPVPETNTETSVEEISIESTENTSLEDVSTKSASIEDTPVVEASAEVSTKETLAEESNEENADATKDTSIPVSENSQISYDELAQKALNDGDTLSAYEYYGHAYWEGDDTALEKLNELADNITEFSKIMKYAKKCPTAKDDDKSIHVRLLDGTILKDGDTTNLNSLEGAAIVFGDESLLDGKDYYSAEIASKGAYIVNKDPQPDWAYDTVLEKNHEYTISYAYKALKDNDIYDTLCIAYISLDDYKAEKYDNVKEININSTR
jgi:hypothetical protein